MYPAATAVGTEQGAAAPGTEQAAAGDEWAATAGDEWNRPMLGAACSVLGAACSVLGAEAPSFSFPSAGERRSANKSVIMYMQGWR